ncbi:MAG: hypothetical protein J6R28_01220 [Bacteroides sp.]|nr:hypothetical protein [Bacteroides sp.]
MKKDNLYIYILLIFAIIAYCISLIRGAHFMKQLSIDDFPLMALIGYSIFAIATYKLLKLNTTLNPLYILASISIGVCMMNILCWSANFLMPLKGDFLSILYWYAGISLGYLYWKLTYAYKSN